MLRGAFDHYRSDWMGGLHSWNEAEAVLEKGWPVGAKRLRPLAEKLSAQLPQAGSIRRKLTWADDGDEICKDRLQSGQIEQCWRTMRRAPFVAPQTVPIETTWGGHYGQTAEELFWHGSELSPSHAEVLNGGKESVHIGTISTEPQAIAVMQQFIAKGNEQ